MTGLASKTETHSPIWFRKIVTGGTRKEMHSMNRYSLITALLLALLKKQQQQFGDNAPLQVANPQNPAWSPGQAKGEKPMKRKARK